MSDHEYFETRRVVYGSGENAGMTFVPVCEACGRYVKADRSVKVKGDGQPVGPNATCSKCGRVQMLFEGYCDEYAAEPVTGGGEGG